MKKVINFRLNDQEVTYEIESHKMLLELLRDNFQLTGTKEGCGMGECGACTVLVDGDKAINSCLALAATMNGKKITTIAGLEKDGELDPVQQAFIDKHAIQCGYCTCSMVMKTKSLLSKNPNPTEDEIKNYPEGNISRCTGYVQIVDAVQRASELMSAQADK